MNKGTAAFIGGLLGGFIMLSIDQLAFASNISSVNTVNTFSILLFGASAYVLTWIVYILTIGVIGWGISFLMPAKLPNNYFYSGLIIGLTWWGAMNIIAAVTGMFTPTWLVNLSSVIVNLVSHLILGIVLTYTISKLQTKAVE